MSNTADIQRFKALAKMIDEEISLKDKTNRALTDLLKEKKEINKKHNGLNFILKAVLFSAACAVILEMIYSFSTSDFNYVLLAPVIGAFIEFIIKIKYDKGEKKATLKSIEGHIKKETDELNFRKENINTMALLYNETFSNIIGHDDVPENDMMGNVLFLEYALQSASSDKINFINIYEEFFKKFNLMDNDEKYKELKDKITQEQTKYTYRKNILKKIEIERKEDIQNEKSE